MLDVLYFISTWFLIFLIYSCLGWIMEVIMVMAKEHRLTNRGFLVGPIVPIYGTGALLVSIILSRVDNVLVVFGISMLGACILEYVTSFIMEKLFHARWWDYSDHFININGRICLSGAIIFGVIGVLIAKISNPFILDRLAQVDPIIICLVAIMLFAVFVIDIVTSLRLVSHFSSIAKSIQRDATDEISQYARATIMAHSKLGKRLVKAFPNLEVKKTPPRRTRAKSKSTRTSKTTKGSKNKTPSRAGAKPKKSKRN